MQVTQESFNDLLGGSKSKRQAELYDYACNLLRRDISHIQLLADTRQANSHALHDLLRDICETLSYYID